MKKRFLAIGIGVLSAGIAFSGMTACQNLYGRFIYDDAMRYSVGGASVAGTVTQLEVDWLSGSVNVAYGDVEKVTFSESANQTLAEKDTVHYWLENTTLHIKYAQSGSRFTANNVLAKDLTVILPASLALNGLEIDSVAADVILTDIKTHDVDIEIVSGDVNGSFNGVHDFSVDIVSGNAELHFATAPNSGEYQNVRGDMTLYLPAETGFTLELEKARGSFECEFETVKRGDRYVCGNGANEYDIETVSGNVYLKKTVQ